ncbi:hydroxyacylglutathione hydrolase-like protein isoform X4 [Mirounga angustirostris]|uniref:hydroxyacylglutathione hydrolase-like protein isoform X4 n=1 Tax=Mirounga angustirostris TaxID=9716 RepID=UPI00313A78B7
MGVHRVGAFCVPTVSGWALGWAGERTPCLGLEREAPALRKGFESLGASREDAGCLSSATMKVKVIPVLEDNYMYLVIEERTREAVAVDVAVPKRFGAIHVRCLLTPGHTSGHMSYFLWEEECPDPPAVFSGDALSVAGCGLRLESTAEQMYESLKETLGSLPPETKVFCGHEHTLGNLEFAQKVEPGNDHVRAKLSWAKKRDEDDMPTVPSTLSEELLYNPFLRVAEEPVRKFTGKAAPAEVLEALCKERASFQRAAEPVQPQARALLALQWGLLGTPRQK